jgi:hypothetical protein
MLAARWRRPPRGSQEMSSTVGFKHSPNDSRCRDDAFGFAGDRTFFVMVRLLDFRSFLRRVSTNCYVREQKDLIQEKTKRLKVPGCV